MKPDIRRIAALLMAVTLSVTALNTPVQAAAPTVSTDETAYVTLDYYGGIDYLSIVKACSLHGITQFSDYGDYQSVSNMTTLDQPLLTDGKVTWEITEEVPNRFYYEVTPKEQSIALPWTFDLSYRLNGQPAAAESLAGASGLIEIQIDATPNPKAPAYLRDNFMLLIATVSSTEDHDSFQAPGAQLQSIGSYRVAFYPILPKGEESVVFSFGTDCFESPGIFMLMVPITLSYLDDIAQIQEHKDHIEASGEAVSSIFDDLFLILGGMKGGIGTTVEGLDELEQARKAVDQNRDTIQKDTRTLIDALDRFRRVTWHLGDELNDSRMDRTIDELGDSFGKIVDALGGMGAGVENLKDAVSNLNDLMEDLQKAHELEKQKKLIKEIRQTLADINDILADLEKIGVSGGLDSGMTDEFMQAYEAVLASEDWEEAQQVIDELTASMENALNELSGSIQEDLSTTMEMLGGMQTMQSNIYQLSTDVTLLLNETSDMVFGLADLLQPLSDSLDTFDRTLQQASDHLNEGTRLTLAGMSRMLLDLSDALNQVDDLQNQKDIIADIIREEWDRLDEDFSLFTIDTQAEKQSFTSSLNPAPDSVQIVLRTREIEQPEEAKPAYTPVEEPDLGLIGRIREVFVKIGQTVGEFFS